MWRLRAWDEKFRRNLEAPNSRASQHGQIAEGERNGCGSLG